MASPPLRRAAVYSRSRSIFLVPSGIRAIAVECRTSDVGRRTSRCRCPPVASVRLRSRARRPSALRAHHRPPPGLPLFPRVGFFGGAGCPSICETHPAPPKKLRAEGRGGSSGGLLPHEAWFTFDRAPVRCEGERSEANGFEEANRSPRKWCGRKAGQPSQYASFSSTTSSDARPLQIGASSNWALLPGATVSAGVCACV